ncbi:ABC transporter permease [Devosia sp.]|uniref:ABC transporter permease n=1 Tax=Devosia sp. TaxID=1871048 RepID=UPI001ACD0E34|nr:ABC transporter permease [Devosia sp.]MBN9310923.1 ABC transporter permease [Devosia sp.]
MGNTANTPVRLLVAQSLSTIARERTVALLALLFLVLVVVAAYLGWSATSTVNAIYLRSVDYMTAQGQTIPSNPVLDTSPLALLRNMATYVSLIGALAAIVVGHQLIASDRKAGTMPLLGTRPLRGIDLGIAKAVALLIAIAALVAFAAVINTATFLVLPEFRLDAAGWTKLAAFYGTSGLYLLVFGFLGMWFGAAAKSETVGLLIPVTVWLTLTFVLPQVTSNINPVAALNPVSALADAPVSAFFQVTGWALGPFSLAEAYRVISAQLLDFMPPTYVDRAAIPAAASLLIAAAALGAAATRAVARMDMTKGDYDA